MPKVWEILPQEHPEALVFLANYQWNAYATKLDIFLVPQDDTEVYIRPSYPSLSEIDKTMRQPPQHQERGKGW